MRRTALIVVPIAIIVILASIAVVQFRLGFGDTALELYVKRSFSIDTRNIDCSGDPRTIRVYVYNLGNTTLYGTDFFAELNGEDASGRINSEMALEPTPPGETRQFGLLFEWDCNGGCEKGGIYTLKIGTENYTVVRPVAC